MSDANLPGSAEPLYEGVDYDTCLIPEHGGCGKRKPLDDFQKNDRLCKACRKRERADDKALAAIEAEQKVAARQIGKMLIETERRKQRNLPATSHVLNLIIDKFGSYEAYADWYYRNAISAEEGSKTALDAAHRLMTTLIEANRQEMGGDLDSMDDEELTVRIGQLAMQARANIVDGTVRRIEQQDADE